MAYTPREIKDRVAVGDDIFIVEDLGNNRIRLIPDPTHVSEPGTPVNKALLQPIEDYLATGVVPVERTITAGSGLSGGGSLNADRTLSLGTPSTLSGATSNNVTSTSHTHAISVATQAEAEAGTNNVKLMTPLRVKEAIASQVPTLGSFYKLVDSFISSGEVGINEVAGIKNSLYRGKNLGTSVTYEQWASITYGTFEDLFIGDYWTINGTTYLIAAFNYYYHSGRPAVTESHITLTTAGNLYRYHMNSSNTTEGGYANSEMRATGLDQAKTKIYADFSGRVLTHKRYLSNAVVDSQANAATWYDSDVELMNEVMVFGSVVNGRGIRSSNIGTEKSQLPLFALRPDLLNSDTSSTFWLRDVASSTNFVNVSSAGHGATNQASNELGVRPVFSIY